MNSKENPHFLKSNDIIQKAYSYFRLKIKNKSTFSFYELPTGITKEMLYNELKCMDLASYYELVTAEYLWKQYMYIHTSFNNKFGFTQLPTDVVTQQEMSLFKYLKYPKQINKKSQTSRKRSTTINRSSSKRKQKSYFVGRSKTKSRRLSTRNRYNIIQQRGGFSGNTQNLQRVITNINQNKIPNWRGSFSTFVKIKDINNQKIYLHASSLPIANKYNPNPETSMIPDQSCSNLLNYYRFVMDIPKIISLQGCELDWSFLPISYIPELCHDLNELTIWNETCSRYNEPNTNTENTEVISDPRSNMIEFYWIDMHSGYFSVYDSLSKIDFTNIANNSLIHCQAGYGRTGIAILLVICVNYYRNNKGRFNSDFFVNSRKPNDFKSSSIVNKLKSLLENFIEIDADIPNNLGIYPSSIRYIQSSILKFNTNHILREVFLYNFQSDYGYNVSYTAVNVFITRVNYIIYFTALRNNIKQFPLFSLKSPSYFRINSIKDERTLFEHILNKSNIYSLNEVEKIMNDADILGFDLQELPIVEGFDFELLQDIVDDDTMSSSRCSIS
jgi:hypothetical protein